METVREIIQPGPEPGENQALLNKVILVADDEPLNLKMMKAILSLEGCRVLEASDGFEAVRKAEEQPDLILLDIMMPDQDGFETCRILKAKAAFREIPIIFLSAFQDPETKVTGLKLGGVDYITKPFQREELLARVRTHLTLREQEKRLRAYTDLLEEMVEDRTRQLVHADRLAVLGTLVAAVAHEINNPLQAIMGHAELTRFVLIDLKNSLSESSGPLIIKSLEELAGRIEQGLMEITKGCNRLNENIHQLKNFGKRGTAENSPFAVRLPIEDAIKIMQPKLRVGIGVEVHIPNGLKIRGNRLQMTQIFINLIHNAVDALNEKNGKISISAQSDPTGWIVVEVKDNGRGIPEDMQETIFDPFFTTKSESEGTGLGLFISRKIVESHRGVIQVVRHDEPGAWFRIRLPGLHQEPVLPLPDFQNLVDLG